MEEYKEQQAEELEVLQSIYEGEESFKELSPNCFQYKYGEEDNKSVLVEISWPDSYPSIVPNINLELFHNRFLPVEFKNEIKEKILEQAEELLDSAMTYSLFDWMKENADDFINRIPELIIQYKREAKVKESTNEEDEDTPKVKKEKKEQLTKAQKRRVTEQTNYKGERERGWDWVDVVRHLSQIGVGSEQRD